MNPDDAIPEEETACAICGQEMFMGVDMAGLWVPAEPATRFVVTLHGGKIRRGRMHLTCNPDGTDIDPKILGGIAR